MTDPGVLSAMQVLSLLTTPAYFFVGKSGKKTK
jgi:hypothetical protein